MNYHNKNLHFEFNRFGDSTFVYEFLPSEVKHHDIINIKIPKDNLGKGYLNKRTLLSVSSCGICGKQDLGSIEVTGSKLKETSQIKYSDLVDWFYTMKENQQVFQKTGGLHAMMILNKQGEILALKEDIGRHNALDKAIGSLLEKQTLKQAHCLLVSGRVSYEIISKAFIAKIPTVVAVSACSTLAVDFAKEFGVSLIGFSRGKKSTIYT